MKKQLLKLSLTIIALLMGGAGSAFAENTLIWSLDFTEKAPATNAITYLTSAGDYKKVGQSGWSYASQYVTEFDNIALARLSNSKLDGFALRTNGSNKGLHCLKNSYTMTLVSMKQNYIITVKTSANAITEQYKGNYGADASSQTSDNNTTYTYKMLGDGDLNLLVASGAYVKSITVEKPDETAVELKYTVNAVCNGNTIKTFESGTALSTDNKMVFYPICLNVDNTWYVTAEKQYGIVIDSNIKNIEYTANKNIVAFAEAESSTNASSDNINYSSGKSGYVKYQNVSNRGISMGTLAPGKYKMVVSVLGNAFRGVALRNQNSTDSDVNIIAQTDMKSTGLQIVDFVLTESLPLIVNGKNAGNGKSNQSADFDYIYIEKTAETLTLNTATDYTNSTFCSDYDLDFSGVNDVEVYKAAIQGDKVVTTKIEDGKVKAGTGIIIKNVNHVASVTVPVTSGVAELTGNDLVGVTADMTNTDFAGKNAYILVSDTQFQKVDADQEGTIKKGKAYLEAKTAGAKPAMLFIGDATTGIESVESQTKGDDAIYTIQGIRVKDTNAKGIYIINGKKYKF